MGAMPEGQIRQFLDKHLPEGGDIEDAEIVAEEEAPAPLDDASKLEMLQHAVAENPADDAARFDYVKALLAAGRTDDAKVAFAPVIAKVSVDRKFEALQRWMDAIDASEKSQLDSFDTKIAANKRDFDSRFAKAQSLIAQRRWTDAMDELLEILMRDKAWNEDLARKTYIAVLEVIEPPKPKVADGQIPPDDPTVATYRRRLSSVVLS
jgi:putative thioredoxin